MIACTKGDKKSNESIIGYVAMSVLIITSKMMVVSA
jgi:hypothetical protein